MTSSVWYPEGGFVPPEVWWMIADLGVLAAIVAVISGLVYLWKRGPAILIKNGPDWWTKLGRRWYARRTSEEYTDEDS